MPAKRKRTAASDANGAVPATPLGATMSQPGRPKRVRPHSGSGDADGEATNGTARSVRGSRAGGDGGKYEGGEGDHEEDHDDGKRIADVLEYGEGGERASMHMVDPPKAGHVHPKGFRTNPPPVGRAVRIYADGVFDLFHLGHMRQLQQAKQAFPDVHLIVGVTGDKETHRRKGLTVLSAAERAESVRHCRWVDEVVEDCPWIIADAPDFMARHAIDYVAHDDIPYGADEGDDIYAPIKRAGKFLVTQRTEGVSTTGIITKIVRDYDGYIARQLSRGASRQELNVSWLKKNEIDVKNAVAEMRDAIRSNWSATGQELSREIKALWQPSSSTSAPGGNGSAGASAGGSRDNSRPESPSRLDIPKGSNAGAADFAAGYSLGLVGGVRSWMSKSRRNLRDGRNDSDLSNDEGSPTLSPRAEGSKKPGNVQDEVDAQVQKEMQ